MSVQKGFITRFGEMIDQYRAERRAIAYEQTSSKCSTWLYWLRQHMVPNIGTLILIVVLALAVPTLAGPAASPLQQTSSGSVISYQGRLADSGGNPITGKQNMEFRLYDVPTGGTPLWTEMWTGGNAADVSDGLFSVMLGSIETGLESAVGGNDELYLGITVGTDSEMEPRAQLGSVPFSMQAMTVSDGSITTGKLADGAVTQVKAPQLVESTYRQDDSANNLTQTNQYLAKGWGCWGPTDGTTSIYVKNVTFPFTYADVPIITLSLAGDSASLPASHGGLGIDMNYEPVTAALSQSPSGFLAAFTTGPVYPSGRFLCFTWTAIGTLQDP